MKKIIREYLKCDDWFIFARGDDGHLYAVSTEIWPEWIDYPEGSDQEIGAVEKYMLPVALKKWDSLNWMLCPE